MGSQTVVMTRAEPVELGICEIASLKPLVVLVLMVRLVELVVRGENHNYDVLSTLCE